MKRHHFSGQHQMNLRLAVQTYDCKGIIVGAAQRNGQCESAHNLVTLPTDNLLDSLTKWWVEGYGFCSKIEVLSTLVAVTRIDDKLALRATNCQGKAAKGPLCTTYFEYCKIRQPVRLADHACGWLCLLS